MTKKRASFSEQNTFPLRDALFPLKENELVSYHVVGLNKAAQEDLSRHKQMVPAQGGTKQGLGKS